MLVGHLDGESRFLNPSGQRDSYSTISRSFMRRETRSCVPARFLVHDAPRITLDPSTGRVIAGPQIATDQPTVTRFTAS